MVAPHIDLLPIETTIVVAQNNDKVIIAGPFTIGGVLVERADKMLRFVLKLIDTPDSEAIIDWNSLTHPSKIKGQSNVDDGKWIIDIRGELPPPDFYRIRVDLCNPSMTLGGYAGGYAGGYRASVFSGVDTMGLGSMRIKSV